MGRGHIPLIVAKNRKLYGGRISRRGRYASPYPTALPQTPIVGFKGPTSKGNEGGRWERRGRGERKGRKRASPLPD